MRCLALLLLFIAAQGWGQVPKCTQVMVGVWQWSPSDAFAWNSEELCETAALAGIAQAAQTYPAEYLTTGFDGCHPGYKLQRYSAGNMHMQAQLEDFGGWKDVDAGPHEGDYRCVTGEKVAVDLNGCGPLPKPKEGDILVALGNCWVPLRASGEALPTQ